MKRLQSSTKVNSNRTIEDNDDDSLERTSFNLLNLSIGFMQFSNSCQVWGIKIFSKSKLIPWGGFGYNYSSHSERKRNRNPMKVGHLKSEA